MSPKEIKFQNCVLQDINLRFKNDKFSRNILRHFCLLYVKISIDYRLTQFVRIKIGKGLLLSISMLKMERILITLNDTVEVVSGLSFPYHGPFVIIGKNCTVHPQVLIGGDRGKSIPTICDNVFVNYLYYESDNNRW